MFKRLASSFFSSRRAARLSIFLSVLVTPIATLQAEPLISGDTLTFTGTHWWQVENAWPGTGIVCNAANQSRSCTLQPGPYKWVEFLDANTESGLLTIENSTPTQTLEFVVVEQRCVSDHWLGSDYNECGDNNNCIVETRYDRQEPIGDTGTFQMATSDYFGCRVDCPSDYRVISAEATGGIGFDAILPSPSEVKHFQTRGIGTSSVDLLQFEFPAHIVNAYITQSHINAKAVCANF